MAERKRFELLVAFTTQPFQDCTLNRSDNAPMLIILLGLYCVCQIETCEKCVNIAINLHFLAKSLKIFNMQSNKERSFFKDAKYNIYRTMQLDPAAHSKWEVLLLYPHIKALGFHRIANWFWKRNHTFIARWVSNIARNWTGIEIHPGATIGRGLVIDHGMGVVIGETAIIGDDCQLYHGVTLGGTGKQHVKRHPTLEDGAYVGSGAKCLGNITLGKGCKVGANAVVLVDVPAGATAVGIPARIIVKKK